MTSYFNQYTLEADKILKELAFDLGYSQDQQKALRVFKAVLHTLRDRITIQESFQLMAQLPTLIKGLYVQNWKYSERPLNYRNKSGLLEALTASEHLSQSDDFPDEDAAVFAVNTVLKHLSHYVSSGELTDVLAQLPAELREITSFK